MQNKSVLNNLNQKINNFGDYDMNKLLNRVDNSLERNFGKNKIFVYYEPKTDSNFFNDVQSNTLNKNLKLIYQLSKSFNNLNYIKDKDINLYNEKEEQNYSILNKIFTIKNYLLEEKNIDSSILKGIFGILGKKDKLIDILDKYYHLSNKEEIISKIDNIAIENITNIVDIKELGLKIDNQISFFKNYFIDKNKFFDKNNNITNEFKGEILNKNIDLNDIYKILSFFDIKELYLENTNGANFFFKTGFVSNENFGILDQLNATFKDIRAFDGYIYGYAYKSNNEIDNVITSNLNGFRNNGIYIPEGAIDLIENEKGKICPSLDLIYLFKGLKYKELGYSSTENKFFELSKGNDNINLNQEYIFEHDIKPYLKNIKNYVSNYNFYNSNYVHNSKDIVDNILLKNIKAINLDDFLSLCNYNLNNKLKQHKINYITDDFINIKNKIKTFKYIIIADFESSGLNTYNTSDILSYSYQLLDKDMKVIRKNNYFIEEFKQEVTPGALEGFDYEGYKSGDKISREEFINGVQKHINENVLFVFHNGYNFDVNILKSNFQDLGMNIENLNVLDTIHLVREYYIYKNNKNNNTYSYSLDNITKRHGILNERIDKHNSEEDVEILKNLFLYFLDKN